MKHIFAVSNETELSQYQHLSAQMIPKLSTYIAHLKQDYQVRDLPNAIVWTSCDIATTLVSDIPIPAYTNEFRIIMCPDLNSWKTIYLRQLDSLERSEPEAYRELYDYYSHRLSINHILQILGHELAHHSELFLDDFDSSVSDGIWFEEGMAEYISRKYFLTEEEFQQEAQYNRTLVNLLRSRYGSHSLEKFGASTYEGNYASIFFEYWRSFLAINQAVETYGSIRQVFASYRQWSEKKDTISLLDWFQIVI